MLRLLGDADTILDVLYKEREVPDLFEASSFHSQYGGTKTGPRRYAPLTNEQETLLKRGGRVGVLCGARAANSAEVAASLAKRMDDGLLRPLKLTNDVNALVSAVNRLRPDRDTYICLGDECQPWALYWIERVADALRKTQRGGKLRVVLRADPEQLWGFISDLPVEYLDTDNGLFDWITVQPWNVRFVRRWCSDLGVHEVGEKTYELFKLTGGWPMLLERYAKSAGKTWEAKCTELERHIVEHRNDLLDAVGLGTPTAWLELAPLRAWGTLSSDDVDTYADLWAEEKKGPPVAADVLRRRLFWATQLGIVHDVDGATTFNPLIERLLLDAPQ